MIYLRKKVGGLREIIYGFCTVKATNLFQNQETSFYEKQESSFYEKQESSFYENKKRPSTGTRSGFMSIFGSKHVQDSLTVVGAEGTNLGLLEAVFS